MLRFALAFPYAGLVTGAGGGSAGQLSAYPTRELDDFERSALPRLRTEEDVVIKDGSDRLRFLGSLRARTSCLKCHSAVRGELLGALSYELLPE